MSKPVWRNPIERDAWIEKNCRVCYQYDQAELRITGKGPGCPHLARAEENRLPTPWTLRRNAPIGETYRCDAFIKKPPVVRRGKVADETSPMLDPEPGEYLLIPVEGWPDYRSEQRKQKGGDHQ